MQWIRLAAGAMIAALLALPQPAAADFCIPQPLEAVAAPSDVIVLGEIAETGSDTVVLRVEEYWQGGGFSPELVIDSRRRTGCDNNYVNWPKISKGQRIVALLQPAAAGELAGLRFATDGVTVVQNPARNAEIPDGLPSGAAVKRHLEAKLGELGARRPIPREAWWVVAAALGAFAAYAFRRYAKLRRLDALDAAAGPSED